MQLAEEGTLPWGTCESVGLAEDSVGVVIDGMLTKTLSAEQMEQITTELEAKEYTAAAGGGAVSATVTGKMEVKNIDIKPEVIDPDDAEMLGDLVAAAVNEALRAAANEKEEKLGAISGGMSLPGIL